MILKGKTRTGKSRIHEVGSEWSEIKRMDSVLFSDKPGPWILVTPTKPQANKPEDWNWRWIHATKDPDFEIVEENKSGKFVSPNVGW